MNNNFNPTIDGLTTFQISDIVCDTLAVNNNTQLSGTNIINGTTTMTGTVNVNATANLNGVVNIPLYIRIRDNTNATYYTQLSQGSTGFSINNNASSGSILLAVKDAIGTQVNAINITSSNTTFATNLTVNGDITIPSKKITQTGTLLGFNTLSSTLIASGCYLAFTANGFIDQQSNVGSANNFKPTYMNVDANLIFNSGSGIINQIVVGSTGTNNLKSTTVNGTFTLATGGTLSLPNNSISDSALSSNVVLLTASQTLTNKTLTSPVISTIVNTGTLTLPTSTDTLVGRATTDTLTNKTLTTPVISQIKPSASFTLTLPSLNDTLVSRTSTDTLTNKTIDAGTFTNTSTYLGGAEMISGNQFTQYESTNTKSTTLSQATTTSYLIENMYNSSDIYLRNKDASGVAVNHVFAHNGVTLGANLILLNSLIQVFQHGVGNQTNLRQSSSSFIVNNITNSGSTVLRTFNSTGSASVDGIITTYTGTTINNTLTLTNNTNLPSTQVTQTSGQLGYIHQGTILNVPSPVTMTTGTTYYLASMTLPVGLWNVFAQTSYTFSTGGTITYDYATIATTTTSISNDNVLTSGNVTAGTGNSIIRRLNGIFSSTGSTVLYVNIQAVFGAGPVLQYSNTSQTYTRFYAVRIA